MGGKEGKGRNEHYGFVGLGVAVFVGIVPGSTRTVWELEQDSLPFSKG